MRLATGTRLGPYEVLAPLGAGGMGEVYRARDPQLGRDVAIKVLPVSFQSDPDRVARFEREARTLATLNHPHIGAIYGYEVAGDVRALVLELVNGRAGYIWIVEPESPTPLRKLLDLERGVFLRGATWTRDGSAIIVGHIRWGGDIFLAEQTQ